MDDTTRASGAANFSRKITRRCALELAGFVCVSTLLTACNSQSSSTDQEDVDWYHPIGFLNAQASTQLQSLDDSGLTRMGQEASSDGADSSASDPSWRTYADDGPLTGMAGDYVIGLLGPSSEALAANELADGNKAAGMRVIFTSQEDKEAQVADSPDAAVSEVVAAFELGDAERVAGDAMPVPNSANTIELYFAWGKCSIDGEDGAWLTRLNYAHYADDGDTTTRQVVVFVGTLGSLGYEDYADCTNDFDSGDPQIFHIE